MTMPSGNLEPQISPEGISTQCLIAHAEETNLYLQKVEDLEKLSQLR